MSGEAWQNVTKHHQKVKHGIMKNLPFSFGKSSKWPLSEAIFLSWALKQSWSSSTHWSFWLKCISNKNGRIKIFRQIRGILKQFWIFRNTIFEAFWPLCGPEEQGNQFLISQKYPMGSYYQDPIGDHHCMHDPGMWYVDYRIHNIEAIQTLEFSLGWENYLDYNNLLSLYEKWH